MKKTTCLFLMAAASMFTFSCKKDKNKDCPLNEANLTGSYTVLSVKYKQSASSTEVDETNLVDACQKDDVYRFNSNHTVDYIDAGTKCDPDGSDNGAWSLATNTLSLDGETGSVDNFSCSGFSFKETGVDTTGDVLTLTFKKQ